MSESSKSVPETDSVADKLRDSLDRKDVKPDTVNADFGSPITPLQTRSSGRTSAATTTTSSSCSSSSSGSVTDRAGQTPVTRKSDSSAAQSNPTISSADQPTSINPTGAQLKSSTTSAAQSPKSTAVKSPKFTPPSSTSSGSKSSKSTSPSAAKPGSRSPAGGSSSSSPKAPTGNQKQGSSGSSGAAKSSGKSSPAPPQQQIKIYPTGNLFPTGKVQITGMTQGNLTTKCMDPNPGEKLYGYGSVMRGNIFSSSKPKTSVSSSVSTVIACNSDADTLWKTVMSSSNPEEVMDIGNEMFNKGCFTEALKLFDRAMELSPTNAMCHNNRATVLTALGRIGEAVIEYEDAIKLDPKFARAYHNLATLLLRLGQVDNAGINLFSVKEPSDPTVVNMLQLVDEHLNKCTDARRRGEWDIVLIEAIAAMESGADSSPQLGMCKVEALLKLLRLDDAQTSLASIPKIEPLPKSFSKTRFFDMSGEAYISFVKSHMQLALGRFENALTAAEKASAIDPENSEVEKLYRNVNLITKARDRGNDLYELERYTEASSAYAEGLKLDPSNATLLCHRADCFFKVGKWENTIEDCNHALLTLPSYTKARLQRAASYSKLEKWDEAVKDYETLSKEMPYDKEIVKSLFQAQVVLKKSRGEVVLNMEFGGEVEEISSLDDLKDALAIPGFSIVHFFRASDEQCKHMCVFMDALCIRYPSLHFLKVEIEKYPTVGDAEGVRVVPTFKIYKNGIRLKEIVCPSEEALEKSVRHYNR